jgi:Flp pilus assembly protein TadG
MRYAERAGKGRGRRGAALAEFAIILPLLVTVVLACVDFGRFASAYILVTNAARAGAQYGVMNNFTSSTLTAWQNGVRNAALAEVGSGSSSNLTVLTPTTTTDTSASENGLKRVQVTVQYNFRTVVPWNWSGLGLPSQVTLQQKVEMRMIR